MKFKIRKTSQFAYRHDRSPCAGAVAGTYTPTDVRTFKTPEEHDARFPHNRWLDFGTNHRIVDDHIVRDLPPQNCWHIEINTLEELVTLAEDNGGQIVFTGDEIEIYDDYRE